MPLPPACCKQLPLGRGPWHFRAVWERMGLAGLASSASPVAGFSLGQVLGGTDLLKLPHVPMVLCLMGVDLRDTPDVSLEFSGVSVSWVRKAQGQAAPGHFTSLLSVSLARLPPDLGTD